MNEAEIRLSLALARRRGWWIACFYWERKLEELLAVRLPTPNQIAR